MRHTETLSRPPRHGDPALPAAFTLIELLTVVSIMALLSVLALPALNSFGAGNNLSAAGRLVSNLVTIARSEAIDQRTLVQLRLLTTSVSGNALQTVPYRKLSLWKLVQTATGQSYVQYSNWETLPDGVIIEPSAPDPTQNAAPRYTYSVPTGTYYFLNSSLLNSNNSGTIAYEGGAYNFVGMEFSPTGATTYPTGFSTVYLLLTEGHMPTPTATAPVYTPPGHPNWYQVTVNSLTGISEVVRP
jgi:prepilin-type N-terminal cleavage/methylation domain-containing protein